MELNIIPMPNDIKIISEKAVKTSGIIYNEINSLSKEEYIIEIADGKIGISYSCIEGKYYADLTLSFIKNQFGDSVPSIVIHDKPRFAYRGFMIDCARHFFTVEELKKMIAAAAMFKLNVFHWHLSDDQGFRVELDSHKELVNIGSVRQSSDFGKKHINKPYSGFYTKKDIQAVISFCNERCIDIIPEIDFPGHSSAILAALPELCCLNKKVKVKTSAGIFKDILCAGNEKTYNLLYDVFDEISELFPGEFIHIGGDETPKNQWKSCRECKKAMAENSLKNEEALQAFMQNKIADCIMKKNKKCIAWNDSLKGKNLNKNIIIQLWLDKKGLTKKFAGGGGKIIVSDFYKYYADYPYGMTPLKKTYSFNPIHARGLKAKNDNNILGVEAAIWTEYVENINRMGYMCFPRFCAVAETGWSYNRIKDYSSFKLRLKKIEPMITEKGITPARLTACDPNIFKRLSEVISFFNNVLHNNFLKN